MQTRNTDTDLLIRSVIEDAEVRPSRRVWKGVSARLDAEAAGAASVSRASGTFFGPWTRWAGASLALSAAAAAVVLYLNPASAPDQVESISSEPAMVTAMLERLSEPEIAEEPAPAATKQPTIRKSAPAINAYELADAVPECEERTEDPAAQAAPAAEERPATARRATKSSAGSTEAHEYANLFEGQDSHIGFSLPTHMYAKGAISGNSSDLAFNNKTAQMAPSLFPSTGITELSESTYGVPFTVGIGIRKYILPKFSIGTGLDYSLLTRTFSGKYTKVSFGGIVEQEESGSVFHSMSYLGIPLNFYYDVISSNKIDFYVYGGGEAEYCVANNYRLYSSPDIHYSTPVKKFQYSVGAGLGVEFSLTGNLGLYIDPEVTYYFHCNQPKNIRTEKPMMVSFNAGLRFKL